MKNRLLIPVMLAAAFLPGCQQKSEKMIMTVADPVPATEMNLCLSHEHVLVDFIGADSTGYHRWDKQEVVQKVLPYLIECTPAYLGIDPWLLGKLSRESGLHLLTNTGYYGAHNKRFVAEIWVHAQYGSLEGNIKAARQGT